jgi:hypothetical protein
MDTEVTLKAQGAASLIQMITGYTPAIIEQPNGGALISFNEGDREAVTAQIESLITKAIKAPAGDVSFDILPVVSPLAFKYVLPVIIALILFGAAGGYFIGHK